MPPLKDSIGAVVLAAGRGVRMGTPKLRLPREGKSYLEHILDLLRQADIAPIVSIVAAEQERWARAVAKESALMVNPHPEAGMLSSIQLGVAELHACSGLFIVPVDHPFVSIQTYRSLIIEFENNPSSVVKPVYQQRSGHPIVIPQQFFGQVLKASSNSSLRSVLQQISGQPVYIEVDDCGILRNINEKDDLDAREFITR